MTDTEWQACAEPRPMLEFIWSMKGRRRVTRRKLRLFGCACARRAWHLLEGPYRDAVTVAEQVADGEVDAAGRQDAFDRTWALMMPAQSGPHPWSGYAVRAAALTLTANALHAGLSCRESAWAVAWAQEPHSAHGVGPAQEQAARKERQAQAAIVRDVFRPHRPTAEPAWLTSTVIALAKGIYHDRAFDRLPILADALQDANCDFADLLNHCREPGEHVRGCWAVDLILGKE